MNEPDLIELLDERRLMSDADVRCLLGPKLGAVLVATDDFSSTFGTIEGLCQTWGGACFRLYAVERDAASLPAALFEDQSVGAVELVGGCGLLDVGVRQEDHNDLYLSESDGIGDFLLPALLAAGDAADWSVRLATLDPSDPWAVAYIGVLGTLPLEPISGHLLQAHSLRQGLRWDDVIDVEVDDAVTPGASDLLNRLRDPQHVTPARLSCALLGVGIAGRDSGIAGPDSPLPAPHVRRSLVGPNLVVVYEPGSVTDLALLWNLRAAHGLPPGLPLAVPVTADVPDVLRTWLAEHAPAYFGLGGDRRPRLTSTSVSGEYLREIAAAASPFTVGEWSEFRQVGRRPGRTSLRRVRFEEGRARMQSWTDRDRIELGGSPAYSRPADLRFTVSLTTRSLPPARSLRPEWASQDGYWEWGYRADDRGPDDLVSIGWPSGWKVLTSVLADRGLRPEPSSAGLAAASLLRRLGSVSNLAMLLDAKILARLHRLSTARSMTWFRERTRELAMAASKAQDDAGALASIERLLEQMTVRPSEEEQPQTTIEQLRSDLSNNRAAAAEWIRWAERNSVLVRGTRVECSSCGAKSWRPIAELGPPVICRGCGTPIEHPYPEGELKFRYRASEPLLRLAETDGMAHLLSMRFFSELWRSSFGRPGALYGSYPGVDIYEGASNVRVGEADLLLVLSDGQLVPGECKRRGAGLSDGELGKLQALAERLGAPWSFVATMDWAEDCPDIWRECIRFAPDPSPRVALTGEHLLAPIVFWGLGTNIFEWKPADAEQRDVRHQQFVEGIVQRAALVSQEFP